MPTKRGLAKVSARTGTAVVGIAVAVATVSAVQFGEWPVVATPPLATVVSPQPSEQQLVCPGPLFALGEDPSQASAATSVGTPDMSAGAKADVSGSVWSDPESADLAAVDNAQGTRDSSPVVLSVPVESGADSPPLVAGSQSQTAASETLGGFAAAACTETASEAWLVGGSTDIGHTSLVLLANPTTVVASVDLAILGETGRIDAPGSTGILVQPGEQRIISLAGLAPNVRSPVVQVIATGGQIAASLEESSVRGIDPGGAELLGPTAPPAVDLAIPGVLIASAADPAAVTEEEEFSDETPTIRVLVPGTTPARVEVGVFSEDGQATGASQQVRLEPGIATEIPLTALTSGVYTVRLNSDQPLVAAARTAVSGTASRDFGWFVASRPLASDFALSIAPGPSPTLHLYNPGSTDTTVSVNGDSGASTDVAIAARQSAFVAVASDAQYTVTNSSEIIASIGYSGDGVISSFAVNPPGPLATPITVYSR
ncbi:MAG TPA: DUF5719 family protein [Glaciibacter sp.]|nr:DUF5719 family protein [Glaciibacter sp.]